MKILPKEGVLVVEKHKDEVMSDMLIITENEDDKNLFTVKVIEGDGRFPKGSILVVGRYSLYKLVFAGSEFFFVEEGDVIAKVEM